MMDDGSMAEEKQGMLFGSLGERVVVWLGMDGWVDDGQWGRVCVSGPCIVVGTEKATCRMSTVLSRQGMNK